MKTLTMKPSFFTLKTFEKLALTLPLLIAFVVFLEIWHTTTIGQKAMYIFITMLYSVFIDWVSTNTKSHNTIRFEDNKLTLLNIEIIRSEVNEVLYCQHKRFEHQLRFRFHNKTYRDFELSDKNVIDDLALYEFLVENKFPIKMLSDNERLS